MSLNSMGVMTKRDTIAINRTPEEVQTKLSDFANLDRSQIDQTYEDAHDARDWNLESIKKNIKLHGFDHIRKIMYRPFDYRFAYYTNFSRGFLAYPVYDVGRHMLSNNLCLTTIRKADIIQGWTHVLAVDGIMVHHALTMKEGNYTFPLYLYPDEQDLDQSIRVNLDSKLLAQIRKAAGLKGPIPEPDSEMVTSGAFRSLTGSERPDEVKVFDYIYGVHHCPAYRETYAECLKIDFPRVPLPNSPDMFRTISAQGETLRRLHLMENAAIGDTPYLFEGQSPEGQDCLVDKPRFENGRVYINGKDDEGQYFDDVPDVSWNLHIGGYRPAQKWLKDRKGLQLSWEDIRHYQKIIKILVETDRLMKGIDMRLFGVGDNDET